MITSKEIRPGKGGTATWYNVLPLWGKHWMIHTWSSSPTH